MDRDIFHFCWREEALFLDLCENQTIVISNLFRFLSWPQVVSLTCLCWSNSVEYLKGTPHFSGIISFYCSLLSVTLSSKLLLPWCLQIFSTLCSFQGVQWALPGPPFPALMPRNSLKAINWGSSRASFNSFVFPSNQFPPADIKCLETCFLCCSCIDGFKWNVSSSGHLWDRF